MGILNAVRRSLSAVRHAGPASAGRRLFAMAGCTLSLFMAAPVLAQHHHEGDIIIGRSDTGQLLVEADLDECKLLLPVNPPLHGWTGDEPGFEALEADEPDEGLFTLAAGAQIWLEAISLHPGLRVWRNDLGASIVAPGQRIELGGADLHDHVIWNLDPLMAGFDPAAGPWSGTFKLVDLGSTAYAESDAFTLCFTNVPEPATSGLLAIGSLVLLRRRRAHAASR